MSDWIHCNRCTILLKDAKNLGLLFYLTNCGHILCAECRSNISSSTCPVCQAVCNTVELNARIGPEIQVFFSDTVQMLKKHQKVELQVVEFQTQHIKRLLSSSQQERAQFELERKQYKEEIRRKDNEISALRAENSRLRSQSRTPDTPSPSPHTPPTKQSAYTPNTPSQAFYTPLARSPSPMAMGTPVGQVRTPPGPTRYSLKTGGSSQSTRPSKESSLTSPVSNQKIRFPSSSQRTQITTPLMTPGITGLLQSSSQGQDYRTPPAYRAPLMGQNIPRGANKWNQQRYSQTTQVRNPLQIPSTRGVSSKLNK
ncbi:E3 SUMO-protein ligase [Oopsacas minuta]|uniref:E3 SUMO-protein ligase n=1 Tax=Oopsacas minuta TaxID=111878 RepID=A0AAV7KHM9_9METZ|nr:E3 SUMO-protein ligase [Oopsacas minuta]